MCVCLLEEVLTSWYTKLSGATVKQRFKNFIDNLASLILEVAPGFL